MARQQGHEAVYAVRDDCTVRVKQDTTKVDGLGGEVWAGAYVLCDFLKQNPVFCQQKRVIELGAGCGLTGLVAACCGASQVVLTDEYPDLLDHNIDLNKSLLHQEDVKVISSQLDWEVKPSWTPFEHQFDLVIGSEITQLGRKMHFPLVETIFAVLKDTNECVALLSMDACNEQCLAQCDIHKCPASHFVHTAQTNGFQVVKHASVRLQSVQAAVENVGALGSELPLDKDDWSMVLELHKQPRQM